MIYKIKEYKDKLIEKAYKEGMKEFNEFFNMNWVYGPNVCILNSRKEIDLFHHSKTEKWVCAFGNPGEFNNIYILDNEKMEKESSHKKYSDEEYSSLIKHELCHLFFMIVSKSNYKPFWLVEGVSIYLSGQMKNIKQVEKFSNFIEFYENGGSGVYSESGMAVRLLVKNFGKEKLLKLISCSKEADNKEDFAKLFKEIYNFNLNYKNFNNLLNKK